MAGFSGIVRTKSGTPQNEPVENTSTKWQKSPKNDLIGLTFGRLTVKSYFRATIRPTGRWKCLCDCGNETIVSTVRLKQGRIKTCGLCPKVITNLEGKRVGLLEVMERAPNKIVSGKTVACWKCICQCGNIAFVPASALLNNHTKSCGCLPYMTKSLDSPINIAIRRLTISKKWKAAIFIRDCGVCQHCGDIAEHAHHIKFLSTIIQENRIQNTKQAKECQELWDLDNGIALCASCHIELHRKNPKEV